MALKFHIPDDFSKEFQDAIVERLIMAAQYAGEKFVEEARNQPGDHAQGFYEDKTGNLRNSIGYLVYHNGELVSSGGSGSQYQNIVSSHVGMGIQLIGVAGMNYASYVEAKGYNVITIQADACVVRLEEYMKDVREFADNGQL